VQTEPYLHVFKFCLGGYLGHKYPIWCDILLRDVNAERMVRGMPPLVTAHTVSADIIRSQELASATRRSWMYEEKSVPVMDPETFYNKE